MFEFQAISSNKKKSKTSGEKGTAKIEILVKHTQKIAQSLEVFNGMMEAHQSNTRDVSPILQKKRSSISKCSTKSFTGSQIRDSMSVSRP